MKIKYFFKIYFYISHYLPINIKFIDNEYIYGFYLQFDNSIFLYEDELFNYLDNEYNILLKNVIHRICVYLSDIQRDLSPQEINFILSHYELLNYYILFKLNKKIQNNLISAYLMLKELKESYYDTRKL